jgi:hypothetical protein
MSDLKQQLKTINVDQLAACQDDAGFQLLQLLTTNHLSMKR